MPLEVVQVINDKNIVNVPWQIMVMDMEDEANHGMVICMDIELEKHARDEV